MKKSLGSIFLFLLFSSVLVAQTSLADFSLTSNKSTALVKEAVKITFDVKQKNHTNVMFFFLEPLSNEDYEIKLLNKKTIQTAYHDYATTFTYLLFPLKAKKITVSFDFTIKIASDKAVAQVYEGGRDNTKWIETTDTHIKLKPLSIDIQEPQQAVDLVGDFTLTSKLSKSEITQYDSTNIIYKLKGRGYKDASFNILKEIPEVDIFSQMTDAYSKATKNGYVINRDYNYALVAKKDFDIPSVTLHAYSPRKHKYYTLKAEKKHIKVTQIETASLLDDKEYPQTKEIDFEFYKNILIAILIFIGGFVTAKISNKISYTKKDAKFQDIKDALSAQALILLLLQKYKNKDIKKFVDALELLEYKNGKLSLLEIKTQILKEFK
ncbi:MAG: hypothetical protein QM497_01520 [Sulfurimonas sp.]